MKNFEGQVAIITGSSMGIGKGIAKELASQGASIVLNGRNPERLERTRKELADAGHTVMAQSGDISSPEDCQKLINLAMDEWGRIDILVNNAGVSSRGAFEDLDPKVFHRLINTNFVGSLYPTQMALPHLKASQGSVVFTSALAGLRGLPGSSLYSATKMAQISFAESLQIELSGSGVHVGLVYVDVTMNEPEKRVVGPNGQPIPIEDRGKRSGVSSIESVAASVARNIRKRNFRTITTGFGKLYYHMNRLFPSLVTFVLLKSKKKMEQAYK